MSRYSQDDLSVMAKSVIWHKTNAPLTYGQLIAIVQMRTGLSQVEIDRRIVMMSNNDFSFK